jgi:hypothetical protein
MISQERTSLSLARQDSRWQFHPHLSMVESTHRRRLHCFFLLAWKPDGSSLKVGLEMEAKEGN